MRIWQKIYFAALLLFLVMLNMGLFLAARFIFSYNLGQEQKKAETDCHFLCQNIEHDFAMLEKNGRYQENVIKLLFENYQSYYSAQNVKILLEKKGWSEDFVLSSKVTEGGGQMQIFAGQNLGEPYQMYRVYYTKRLVEFEETWSILQRTFAVISFAMSIFLCLILYVLMRRILKPLDSLNNSVAQIAAGKYDWQAGCLPRSAKTWNNDEIAELSQNVDKMAKTIQSQIFALQEENAKKQQLMDNMAHELKTPLTSIYGYAQYLSYAKATEEETCEGLEYIMEESRRLAKMSEIMLSMRLYEKEEQTKAAVNLNKLALHIEKILFGKLQEKKLCIRKNFEIDTIYGDEELFVNLFRNLLENAIRASREGNEIVWNAKEDEGKQKIEMIDYGIGMEKEELERITEAFYRVDKARSRKEGGVGLGLSVTDLIVKKMNGKMFFSSVPNEGTKVTIFFTTF